MSVVELVKNFKTIIKVPSLIDKPITDNTVFRLHYRTTTLIFFSCCVFVTAYTLFGDPIQCIGDTTDDGKLKVANTFCYLGYTYTIPTNRYGNEKLDGLGPKEHGDKVKYHNYYRWIPLMLFLQGALFYVPHWIWKNWEDKKIIHLTAGIRGPVVEVKPDDKNKLKILAKYMVQSLHTHNSYANTFIFCEILNFINVVLNIYLIDSFLNNEFTTYGTRVLEFTDTPQENRTDPMIEIFPRLTKCDFHKVGPSGNVQNFDFLCVLALNNLNEKIYIFLWFWLIILACISVLPILYSVVVYLSPLVRGYILTRYYILGGKSRIQDVARKTQIGDFFIWDLLGKNMSSKYYREFINELHALLMERDTPDKLHYPYLSANEDDTKF
ncbi:innexin inx3-like [Planococcus citri]|uniref:innexin inx3-like n=1 Tax=Planococcus citri TaxID=170843 RepID=UPI0031FA10E2